MTTFEPHVEDGEPVVTYEVRGPVAVVTVNRPKYTNAQNSKVTYALDAAFVRAVDDDTVKVIVLAGNGRHFSGGHDIGTPGRDIDEPFQRKAATDKQAAAEAAQRAGSPA
ncbi:enoyl-CoA hydratase/carnithine racemase [Cryptosporangium arvum DSM 44712]|uniref:Enoyl-CoA hydratase/carnithine racemase n=1 Tax=Cryptosporangium arvum DSM 44712 TaxID=927661 RepID=A0A010ZUN8_9ACTN|nr:enoyl-CoA hydratase-related protein [Cryptosporangium arvum]EXG82409.1 enoyl-CoA hydratase/carnithine racemase [Cryptosporangium arvum DSM 44712]